MKVLVDYRCSECRRTAEKWVSHPVPGDAVCGCGGRAVRKFGFARVNRSSAETAAPQPGGPLTQLDVPGVCHMSATEARRWTAVARGDAAAERREIEYQERAIECGVIDPNPSPAACSHG